SPPPPAVVQKPPAVVQKAVPVQPATPPVVAEVPPVASETPAVAAAEPTPDDFQPLQTFAKPSVLITSKHGKKSRASNVAAPRVPTTPQQGQLTVSSVPDDATIEIEGLAGQTWRTPQTIGALAPGRYKLTVSKPGYAADVRTVQVGAGSRMAVDVRLTVVKGWLTVAGSPAGASVWIDGRDTGKVTPVTFMLDPATHNVSLHKTGYLDAGRAIQLAAGQTTSYSPSLMVAGHTDNIRIMVGGIGNVFKADSADCQARI